MMSLPRVYERGGACCFLLVLSGVFLDCFLVVHLLSLVHMLVDTSGFPGAQARHKGPLVANAAHAERISANSQPVNHDSDLGDVPEQTRVGLYRLWTPRRLFCESRGS
jgi:hypothetical protein